LAPIRNATKLLEGKNLEPAQVRAQAIISRQVGQLSSLLDDLLDVSRITRGSFLLKRTYVDLNEVLDEAVETAQPLIDAKRHTLRVQRSEEPIILEVDSVRLTQVLSNLLTNAAKYTPADGEITVGSRWDAEGLTIFVRDTGVGLAPEALAQVFTMFNRVESEIGRSEGGLGIGLALAKGLVELHGGRVEALSAGPGKGSEFVVSLPPSVLPKSATVLGQVSDYGSNASRITRRVLIADDNHDGAETLAMILEMFGHEVHVAHSGEEALEVGARCRPDIGILDIGMPDLSGYEVAKRIRHEAWGAKITLIAVTGWGQENDKRMAHAAGFDHHLTKPVDPDCLAKLFGANRRDK
jgi:CheY-like chemotaxis protein